ncbi:hypothetical protein EGP98_06035 [bacterium]|nr:hypothetical protein [bacterium]
MNTEVLEHLMKGRNIKSYYQLARVAHFPYTTLMDLAHNRSNNLKHIKTLAHFFGIDYRFLLGGLTYCTLVDENNMVKTFLPIDNLESSNIFAGVLMRNY